MKAPALTPCCNCGATTDAPERNEWQLLPGFRFACGVCVRKVVWVRKALRLPVRRAS